MQGMRRHPSGRLGFKRRASSRGIEAVGPSAQSGTDGSRR